MSGNVIRDVIVRVKVEADPSSRLNLPGVGAAGGGGGGRGKTPEEQAAAAKAKADREAARAAREAARQRREQERADQKAARDAERVQRDQQRAAEKAKRDAEKAAKEKTKAEKDARDKAVQFAADQKAAVKDLASETFNGVTQMARGWVYLTASSQESLEANVKMIERFEGYVSTAQGVISTTSAIVKAYQVMKTTAEATAVANTALAVSNAAVSASSKGGAASAAAGGAAAAAAGSGGTLVAAGKMIWMAAKPFAATVGIVAAKLALLAVAVGAVYEAFGYLTGAKTRIFSELLGLRGDRANAAAAEERTASMEKDTNARLTQANDIEGNVRAKLEAEQEIAAAQQASAESLARNNIARQRDAAIAAQIEPIEERRAKLLREMGHTDNPLLIQQGEDELERIRQQSSAMQDQIDRQAELASADEARARASQRVTATARQTAAENEKVAKAQRSGATPIFAGAVHAARQEAEARESLRDADENRLALLRQQEAALISQREQAEAQLQTTREQLRMEKEKERSASAKYGRLTAPQRGQLQRINQTLQSGGQINDAQARFLDETGFGSTVAEEHYAERGRREGFGNLDPRLTGVDPTRRKKLEQDERDRQGRFDSLDVQVGNIRQEIRMQEQSLANSIREMGNAFVAALNAAREQADRQARRMKTLSK